MFNKWPENGVVQETYVQRANREARERDERDRAALLAKIRQKMKAAGIDPNPPTVQPSTRTAVYWG
jgi:sRNA-binding protein